MYVMVARRVCTWNAGASVDTATNGAEAGEETAPGEGQRHEPERALTPNHSTSGFTGEPALVLIVRGGYHRVTACCA